MARKIRHWLRDSVKDQQPDTAQTIQGWVKHWPNTYKPQSFKADMPSAVSGGNLYTHQLWDGEEVTYQIQKVTCVWCWLTIGLDVVRWAALRAPILLVAEYYRRELGWCLW